MCFGEFFSDSQFRGEMAKMAKMEYRQIHQPNKVNKNDAKRYYQNSNNIKHPSLIIISHQQKTNKSSNNDRLSIIHHM